MARDQDIGRRFDEIRAKAPKAIARALNRSIASAKTAMVKVISQDLGAKVSDLRDKIGTEAARPDRHRARLSASTKKIPLMAFGARQNRSGVSAKTAARSYPHAFIATMPNKHKGVFRRSDHVAVRTRNPRTQGIRELMQPSIAHVFTKHVAVGQARGLEQLAKNLQSEFRNLLRQTSSNG